MITQKVKAFATCLHHARLRRVQRQAGFRHPRRHRCKANPGTNCPRTTQGRTSRGTWRSPFAKVLFCGPPGCGKTVAAEALARELYLPLATVRFDAVVSSYLGETAANLRKVFDFARSRPLVLFFDEFDAIGKHRTAADEHGELKRVVNSFLQMLDSFRSETLTVAATNHQGLLDSALWRRFDEIVMFPKPTPEEIETLLCRQFRQITVGHSVNLGEAARSLEGFSHADVERVAQDSIKQPVLMEKQWVEPDVLSAAIARQHDRLAVTDSTTETAEPTPKRPRPREKKGE